MTCLASGRFAAVVAAAAAAVAVPAPTTTLAVVLVLLRALGLALVVTQVQVHVVVAACRSRIPVGTQTGPGLRRDCRCCRHRLRDHTAGTHIDRYATKFSCW